MRNIYRHRMIFACCFAPLLLGLPLLFDASPGNNYTGLINSPVMPFFFLCTAPVLFFACGVLMRLLAMTGGKGRQTGILLAICTAVCILLPYPEHESVTSGLHVLFGYLAFGLLNSAVFQLSFLFPSIKARYLLLIVPVLLLTISSLSVTGLVEWIYFSGTLVILTAADTNH